MSDPITTGVMVIAGAGLIYGLCGAAAELYRGARREVRWARKRRNNARIKS